MTLATHRTCSSTHRTCSSTVEQSTADRQVPGATPGRSYFFFPARMSQIPARHADTAVAGATAAAIAALPLDKKSPLIIVVTTWCSGGEKTRDRRTRRPAPAHAPARARIAASSASSCDARRRRSSLSTAAAGVTVYGLWAPRGGGGGTVKATSKGAFAVPSAPARETPPSRGRHSAQHAVEPSRCRRCRRHLPACEPRALAAESGGKYSRRCPPRASSGPAAVVATCAKTFQSKSAKVVATKKAHSGYEER